MPPLEPLSLLAVGMQSLPEESREIDVRVAGSAKETIAMMRLFDFDLLLAGNLIPDMSVWSMIRRIRSVHSDQRWALVSDNLSPADEIQARGLGVLAIFDTTPDCIRLCQLAGSLLNRRPASLGRPVVMNLKTDIHSDLLFAGLSPREEEK